MTIALRLGEMARLSRERICREALALVDDEGLEALSMRRLGARLGVEAMSLYRHVRDKTDLLAALQGAVIGRLVAPRGQVRPWRTELGGQARALRRLLLAHPKVAPLLARMPVQAPEAALTVGRAHESLLRAGLSPSASMDAIYLVGIFTIGHVLFEIQSGGGKPPAVFGVGLEALLDGVDKQLRKARRNRRLRKSR
jgi:AcrR family transcriptional regulator